VKKRVVPHGGVAVRHLLAATGLAAALLSNGPAHAEDGAPRDAVVRPEPASSPHAAVVLPTVTPVEDCSACPTLHKPDPETERQLANLGRELDSVLVEATQDLGLTVDVSARPIAAHTRLDEDALVDRAKDAWVFSPRIAVAGSRVLLRIVAVAPGSHVLLVRSEEIKPDELEVRAVLMVRDLVRGASPAGAGAVAEPSREAEERPMVKQARSKGRAVLAFNAAVLGGYVGFALQRAGGSNDARLTYPLIALGAGLGLGGSMIVAEEWDVGVGDSWFLAAGTWWPVFGALLITDGTSSAKNRRFLYGAGAAAGGLALATTSITFEGMSEGGALTAHSGGAFGTMLGGIADLIVRGRTDVTPTLGMGVGAISGVVLAGTLASIAPSQPPSRVLLMDLSAGLGALTGAAVASPLVFGENVGATRNRLWLSSIALGTFVGAGIGLLTTSSAAHESGDATRIVPTAGVIATVSNPDGTTLPVTGAGVRGVF